jgi:molybdopterin converting factor small subunit
VEAFKETVKTFHEQLRPVRRMLISVNGEFPDEGAEIREGDVVALFPPVSGG